MEVVLLIVVGVAILAAGIRVGMLLAPRVERIADRANRLDPIPDETAAAGPNEPAHEDADDRTA